MTHPSSHHGPPRRPHIGLTPDLGTSTGSHAVPRYELKTAYCDAIVKAGGLPWVLPYTEDKTVLEAYVDRLSGLVLTGGAFDIPPEAYGQIAREGLGPVKPGRTSFETLLLKEALARNLPVLGICGGMQLLNVVKGGTLYQDLRRELPHAKEHEQPQERSHPHHPVEVKPNTLLASMVGKGQLMVNSTHHQAVHQLGENLLVNALAPDGVVEGIESTQHAFAVGVQWHPEMLLESMPIHLGVFRALVQKAREFRR